MDMKPFIAQDARTFTNSETYRGVLIKWDKNDPDEGYEAYHYGVFVSAAPTLGDMRKEIDLYLSRSSR